ncbi:MAG: L-threonine 3-dehydrogenase [Armatimonadota bacterium]|nr:L-threonine 3-dehydrogenase [Armatimonadota bacterium]MDR7452328.1 L-threonine 3-dehydrogenase [Armatimonadota bacterium]MDR7467781.1 L-threonine 3-dehydrogenase [Armatimonadota bacterium]MDR7494633.1 L-threonine 3-dehydrogenase [Armatimonadota bacterium]MDR7499693.1 L-threonine 3-dehydrogenase [Armatimonadota bacterium]
MRAVVKARPGPGLDLEEHPVPEPGRDEVLIRVRAASICGTDLHIWRWDPWAQRRIRPPVIVGHEVCGEVAAVGSDVTGIDTGTLVSAESHVVCGVCDLCRTGRGHLCRNTRILGVDRDGGFAEYVTIPAINAWPNPPEMPAEIAALQENFGNAVHTAFQVDLRARKVLVTGCGPVGVMAIAVAKAIGARAVYATDVSPYRLDLARTMGADAVCNPTESNVVQTVLDLTEGEGVDVLLEMSGAPSALREGLELLKPGGEAALLGLPGRPVELDLDTLVIFKGITVHGIVGRRLWETWYQARGLLRARAFDLTPLVTHRFPLDRFEEAFELMASGQCGKVVLVP